MSENIQTRKAIEISNYLNKNASKKGETILSPLPILVDPHYFPDSVLLADLEEYILTKKTKSRTKTCDVIAMDAAETLLRPLGLSIEIMPQNHKGFDILLDGKLKIQVKGVSFFEHVQGSFKNFDFDIAIVIDVGIVTKQRPKDYLKFSKYPYNSTVKYYIFPQNIVERNVYKVPSSDWWFLFAYKDDQINRSSNRVDIYREFHDFYNRFEIITDSLLIKN